VILLLSPLKDKPEQPITNTEQRKEDSADQYKPWHSAIFENLTKVHAFSLL